MNRVQQIHELVWEKPPEPYGVLVAGRTWQIQTFIDVNIDGKKMKRSVVVWTHDVLTSRDAFYVSAVIYRFGAYLLETFKQLKPDFFKLVNQVNTRQIGSCTKEFKTRR